MGYDQQQHHYCCCSPASMVFVVIVDAGPCYQQPQEKKGKQATKTKQTTFSNHRWYHYRWRRCCSCQHFQVQQLEVALSLSQHQSWTEPRWSTRPPRLRRRRRRRVNRRHRQRSNPVLEEACDRHESHLNEELGVPRCSHVEVVGEVQVAAVVFKLPLHGNTRWRR